ncbi:MAG TPA: D-alanyl-D-alanine carboxypeptidase/D-alanyl-D-alanine-endopeptidase [Thermoleophilia bacterium]|nr:D-alanyl-D-alanine carboxypeptidase/D-alanyl-D-alanine-endopeptidase [Thermoleophilia bacterium]
MIRRHQPESHRPRTTPPRRFVTAVLVLFVLLTLLAIALPATAGASTIGRRITAILRDNGVATARTSVSVYDRTAGTSLYAWNSATLLAPASNMKLVTSSAALVTWPADHRFPTSLFFTLPLKPGQRTVYGDVYLKGYGDPAFSTLTYQREAYGIKTGSIQEFVAYLKGLGIRKIQGRIYGDASWFDAQRVVSSWSPHLWVECGPLSALSLNENWYAGERVDDPPLYVARRFRTLLERAGIDVVGAARAGKVPAGARCMHTVYSAPLATLLKVLNKDSDNFFAEMLLKGIGRDVYGVGSTAAGLRVARETLAALGVPSDAYRLYDGSGLSYLDRLSAKGVVRLLRAMRLRDDWATFRASLAIAGVDGTLATRMRGTAAAGNFRGKSGTLRISCCLSGTVQSADGHQVFVAMLMNGDPVDVYRARRAQDQIAVALARADL